MGRKYQPTILQEDEESSLKDLLKRGSCNARVQNRARILLALHQGKRPEVIATDLFTSIPTIYTIRRQYFEAGIDGALYDAPRSGAPVQIDGKARAAITALACTNAPEGHTTWTLQLLADKAIALNYVETISYGTVFNILKKTN